jgi:hypothetical protein
MKNKRAVLAAFGVLGALALVVALFVGGILGIVFYSIGNSGAAQTAKKFLRGNERLRREIGDVRDFGYFTTGDIRTQGSLGTAELRLKAIGARKTVNATVDLALHRDRWDVIDAFYTDDSGGQVFLTDNFDSEPATTAPPGSPATPAGDPAGRRGTNGAGDADGGRTKR